MTSTKLVTVIMSTFNGERYLRDAIESVRNQSNGNFEFVIVDDCSSDSTWSILTELAETDSRIHISQNLRNRGVGFNYSELIVRAEGEYIAQMGQDDLWHPDFLEQVVSFLSHRDDCAVVFTDVQIINSSGKKSEMKSPFELSWLQSKPSQEVILKLFRQNFLCASSSLFRKSYILGWKTIGDNDLLQDWNTWLHLALLGNVALLPRVLSSYRIHGHNLSLSSVSPASMRLELLHTRTQLLNSERFWENLAKLKHVEEFLQGFIDSYFEIYETDIETGLTFLLFAMRTQENLFRDSPTFRRWLGYLFWRENAFVKALRYWENDAPAHLSVRQAKHLVWRPFAIATNQKWPPARTRWIHSFTIGMLVFGIVRVGKDQGRLPFFRIDASSNSIERCLEFVGVKRPSLIQRTRWIYEGIRSKRSRS